MRLPETNHRQLAAGTKLCHGEGWGFSNKSGDLAAGSDQHGRQVVPERFSSSRSVGSGSPLRPAGFTPNSLFNLAN